MFIGKIFQFLLVLAVIWLLFTQIIWPLLVNKPMFWIFSKQYWREKKYRKKDSQQ